MKCFALFSGGKDSFLSVTIAQEQGFYVDLCVTIEPEEDSMMFQYPNVENAAFAARLLGLRTITRPEERFSQVFEEMKKSGYGGCVAGAIESEYQKTRIERLCTENGLLLVAPLWRKSQESVLRELQLRGIHAIIVSVSADGLDESDLGREIDADYMKRLLRVSSTRRINLAGEGGEFESFVMSYEPARMKVEIGNMEKIWKGSNGRVLLRGLSVTPY